MVQAYTFRQKGVAFAFPRLGDSHIQSLFLPYQQYPVLGTGHGGIEQISRQ